MGLLDVMRGLLGGAGWKGEVERYGGAPSRLQQLDVRGLAWCGEDLIALSHKGVKVLLTIGKPAQPVGEEDALLRWDLARGVASKLPGSYQELSASADGRWLACLLAMDPEHEQGRGVRVLAAADGRERLSLPEVSAAALSADGQVLLVRVGAAVRCLSLDAPAAPRWEVRLPAGDRGSSRALALSADGALAAVAHEDEVVVLDARGQELHRLAAARQCLAFLPDGRLIAGGNESLELWDPRTGQRLATLTSGRDLTLCVACAPDGSRFASGHRSGKVRLWSGAGQAGPVLQTAGPAVGALAWNAAGDRLASGACFQLEGQAGAIQRWDVATGQELGAAGHTEGVTTLQVSPDGTRLVSRGDDLKLIAWQVGAPASGRVVRQLRYSYGDFALTSDLTACVHPVDRGRGLSIEPLDGGPERVVGEAQSKGRIGSGFTLASDGRRALLRLEGALSLIDLQRDSELWRREWEERLAPSAAFAQGGQAIAWTEFRSQGKHELLHLVQAADGTPIRPPIALPSARVDALLVDAAGERVLVTFVGGAAPPVLVEVASGRRSAWREHAPCWALSPDGQRVATTADWLDIVLRDAQTGKPLIKLPRQHRDKIRALTFGPDGTLWSGGEDGLILCWKSQDR